jgi:hypothetical protein
MTTVCQQVFKVIFKVEKINSLLILATATGKES